ncbi:MAG: methyl-accepting chemotaxis protein, partial [Burkholderiaceae bacterium]
MKLALKLPLAFAAAMLLVLGAALYGIHCLNQSINTYSTTVRTSHENAATANELLVEFKTQVQEWKNTLLRGKDPKALDRYWSAFNKIERDVADKAKKLIAAAPAGETRDLVEKFALAHAAMGQSYRKGFDAFKAAGFDPLAGDAAVQGVDREAARLLDDAVDKIEAYGAALEAEAAAGAKRGTLVSIALM